MTRSLIDALNRTEALNLAQSILDDITIEALSIGTPEGWNWFVHFALMGLQLKFERGALPQVLVDLDRLLQLIGQQPPGPLTSASKVIFLCFLNVILATDRKIMSVFMTLPKASQELRQALDDLPLSEEAEAEAKEEVIGAIILGEFVYSLNMLPFSGNLTRSLNRLAGLLTAVQGDILPLPGHLQFASVSDAKLMLSLLQVFHQRQNMVPFSELQVSINSLFKQLSQSKSVLSDTLEMALAGFKMCIDLDFGTISQVGSISRPNADPNYARKFRDFILSFTAHALVGKLGVHKIVTFYDKKLASTADVDLSCLLHLNKLFVKRSTEEFGAVLNDSVQNLHIPQLQLFFAILRVVEMRSKSVAAHHIRDALNSARNLASALPGKEPMLICWLDLLQGEYFEAIDHEAAIGHYRNAFGTAKEQLGHVRLSKLAAGKLSKLFQTLGDDSAAQHWSSQVL